MKMAPDFPRKGFTLIELLIVVAIIAILAAIAVPNFLEAQTRSKVSRSLADMRNIQTAIEVYTVDYGAQPPGSLGRTWWGFVSPKLTTPIAYLTSLPPQVFDDKTWIGNNAPGGGGVKPTIPYIYIYDAAHITRVEGEDFYDGTSFTRPDWNQFAPTLVAVMGGPYNPSLHKNFDILSKSSSYILAASGPDELISTAWWAPAVYDPTNGTVSFGDILKFGGGSRSDAPTGN